MDRHWEEDEPRSPLVAGGYKLEVISGGLALAKTLNSQPGVTTWGEPRHARTPLEKAKSGKVRVSTVQTVWEDLKHSGFDVLFDGAVKLEQSSILILQSQVAILRAALRNTSLGKASHVSNM